MNFNKNNLKFQIILFLFKFIDNFSEYIIVKYLNNGIIIIHRVL